MQRAAALSRIDTKRFAWGLRSTNLPRLRATVRSLPGVYSRGVEAARGPQLTPVFQFPHFEILHDCCDSLSIWMTHRTTPRSSSRGSSHCDSLIGLWTRSNSGSQPNFKFVETKSSMNSFTNRLGRVYPV